MADRLTRRDVLLGALGAPRIRSDTLKFQVTILPLVAAAALNDKGQVLGYVGRVPFIEQEGTPAIWHDGQVTTIGSPPGKPAVNLIDVNNAGEALATAGADAVDPPLISASNPPYLHSRGRWIPLEDEKRPIRWAALNDRGTLLGVSKDGYIVALKNGKVLNVAKTDGYVQPSGMNSAGEFVYVTAAGGFYWNGIESRKLQCTPLALNDKGLIAGQRLNIEESGTIRTLAIPTTFTHAEFSRNRRALNNRGVIVGEASGPRRTAAVWIDERAYDLNGITNLKQGARLERALAVNARNEILAFQRSADGSTQIVLLTPAP